MNVPEFGTGLRLSWDTRNEDYPVAARLDLTQAPVDRKWALPTEGRDNQGSDPECVGAALTQELAADPVEVAVTHPYTRKNIYNLAQKLDEWPGEGYAGTSLNGGMKAARQYGYITEWRWAANVADVINSLAQLGPVVMAGPWLTAMFTPDAEGRVHVDGTAGDIGHCYLLGELLYTSGKGVVIEQSWGPFWSRYPGPDGGWRGLLSFEDLGKLMSMGTQAAIITGRADPGAPTPPAPPSPARQKIASVNLFNLPPFAEVV